MQTLQSVTSRLETFPIMLRDSVSVSKKCPSRSPNFYHQKSLHISLESFGLSLKNLFSSRSFFVKKMCTLKRKGYRIVKSFLPKMQVFISKTFSPSTHTILGSLCRYRGYSHIFVEYQYQTMETTVSLDCSPKNKII